MRKISLVIALALAGLSVSACRSGHPGHDSDRHHGQHDQDHDDHDHYR